MVLTNIDNLDVILGRDSSEILDFFLFTIETNNINILYVKCILQDLN